MRSVIDDRLQSGLNASYFPEETEITGNAILQLDEYFSDKRKVFDIPLRMVGTIFQQEIWNELMKIPYGKTESYQWLSMKIKNEKAIRAVASANGANALAIFIPCHRIVGSNGDLIGYAGGLNAKKKLLELEKNIPEQLVLL
jgi:methylated-DNA-[protein]-cysteine S-methyltransferase